LYVKAWDWIPSAGRFDKTLCPIEVDEDVDGLVYRCTHEIWLQPADVAKEKPRKMSDKLKENLFEKS
jgi:hypothetical protein